jgi:hypothetical protein
MSMVINPYRFSPSVVVAPELDPIGLVDTFTGATIDAEKWNIGVDWQGGPIAGTLVQNDRIEIVTPGDGYFARTGTGITSKGRFSCVDKDVYAMLGPMNFSSPNFLAEFALFNDANNGVFFGGGGIVSNSSRARVRAAGANSIIAQGPSILNNNRQWLRIRFDSATDTWMYWATASHAATVPVAASWVLVGTVPGWVDLDPEDVAVALYGGAVTGPSTASIYFDGLNGAIA